MISEDELVRSSRKVSAERLRERCDDRDEINSANNFRHDRGNVVSGGNIGLDQELSRSGKLTK